MHRVALIGAGAMGSVAGQRLLEAGFEVVAFDHAPEKAAALAASGARVAASVAEVLDGAGVVLTALGTPEDVEDLYLSRGGVIEACEKGAYLVDLTAVAPSLARDVAEYAEMSGRHAFEAAICGTPEELRAGSCRVLCGATESDVEPVLEVLGCLGSGVRCMGGPGKGHYARLAGKAALACALVGLAECVSLAKQGGLDPAATLEALDFGGAPSAALASMAAGMAGEDFSAGLPVNSLASDLSQALGAAEDLELTLPATECASQLLEMLCTLGAGSMGAQSVSLVYEDEQACSRHGLSWAALQEGDPCDDHDHDHGHGCDCGCGGHTHDHEHLDELDDDDDDEYEEYDLGRAYGLESFYDPDKY